MPGPQAGDGPATGARGTVSLLVTEADTALAAGSGDVPVLATPRLLALAEAATVAAIAAHLADGQTSVGTAARLEHRRASPVGVEVTAEAELTAVDGVRLTFAFTAWQAAGGEQPAGEQPAGAIADGTIERVLVDRARFLARASGGSREAEEFPAAGDHR
jgi:fluoroacetyl-CoA thioesterase